jgi:hypothetical protein
MGLGGSHSLLMGAYATDNAIEKALRGLFLPSLFFLHSHPRLLSFKSGIFLAVYSIKHIKDCVLGTGYIARKNRKMAMNATGRRVLTSLCYYGNLGKMCLPWTLSCTLMVGKCCLLLCPIYYYVLCRVREVSRD